MPRFVPKLRRLTHGAVPLPQIREAAFHPQGVHGLLLFLGITRADVRMRLSSLIRRRAGGFLCPSQGWRETSLSRWEPFVLATPEQHAGWYRQLIQQIAEIF